MKIENTQVFGFEASIRALRNPLNSWNKSDSRIKSCDDPSYWSDKNANEERFILGENDMLLSQKLTKAGTEHCKHLRLITVWFDIIAPRFFYCEFDTYKYKENVSCSTMHTLMKKPISEQDFEKDNIPASLIEKINTYIKLYQETNDVEEKRDYLIACKNILPEGFLQKRTVCTNYQTLLNIYKQRRHHKLPQWQQFCDWIINLPYFQELTGIEV
ncbi:MAG: hypothetical protein PWP67_2922 [Clostridium butyricum]|nr:hypothetical protein [Clostridium butyricum]